MAETLEVLEVLLRGRDVDLKRILDGAEREAKQTGSSIRRSLDFRDIGASLGGLAGGGGILYTLRQLGQESARTNGETRSFFNTLERAGISRSAMTTMLDGTADRVGLLRTQLESSSTPLLKMGVDADLVNRALLGLASSAGIAGKSGRELAQSVESGAIGLATGRSELLEGSNVILNASQAWEQYADSIGVSVSELTDQQKAIAYVQGVIRETAPDVEDFADSFGEFAQSESEAAKQAQEARTTIGNLAQEALIPLNKALATGLGWFNDLPEPVQRTAVAMVAAGAGATALAGGVGTLALVLGPLLGPAGLLILAATAIAGIVTAVESVETTSAQGELERLGTAAETAAGKIGTANDKAALKGALTELGEVAGGEAKERIQELIDKLDDAGVKFDQVKGQAQEMVAELALAPLQAQKAAIQAQILPTERLRGAPSVDGLVRDYESRLTRQLGFEVDIRVERQKDGSFEAVTDSLEGLHGTAEQAEIVMGALATITASANDRSANLTDQQRELRQQLAEVNTQIEAQKAALEGLNGASTSGSPGGTPPGGRGTDEQGDYVVAPQPSAEVVPGKPIATPEVEVKLNGEPIDIFGVVFDPTTGNTAKGAAPTAEVNVEVKELPRVPIDVNAARTYGRGYDYMAEAREQLQNFRDLRTELQGFTGSQDVFAALPDSLREAAEAGEITLAQYRELLAIYERLASAGPIDLVGSPNGPKGSATAGQSVALLPGATDPDTGRPLEGGITPTVEVDANPFAEAGADFLSGLAGVLSSGASELGAAIASGNFSDFNAGSFVGGLAGLGGSFLGDLLLPGLGSMILGPLLGGLFGGLFGGGEDDSRSRAEQDAERRGGASSIELTVIFTQNNSFEGNFQEQIAELRRVGREQIGDVIKQINPSQFAIKPTG